MTLLLTAFISAAWLHSPTIRRCAAPIASIEAMESSAQQQRDLYFELMPSQALPTTSLDMRAWMPKDKDNFEAQVMARQDGTVAKWRNIGVVATVDAACFSAAVAKQRDLIARWAYEACNNFETNELLMDLDGAPIELGWTIKPEKPSLFDSLIGQKKAEKATVTLVEPGIEFDDVRCGFLGVVSREYRGGGVSSRSDRIVLGQPPEVPKRRESQAQFKDSPYKTGGGTVSFAKAAPGKK